MNGIIVNKTNFNYVYFKKKKKNYNTLKYLIQNNN